MVEIEKIGIKVGKKLRLFGLLVFFAQACFPVNSKVFRAASRTFAATLRVRKRKLLGIGTGGQGPPKFCTGGAKSGKKLRFSPKLEPIDTRCVSSF